MRVWALALLVVQVSQGCVKHIDLPTCARLPVMIALFYFLVCLNFVFVFYPIKPARYSQPTQNTQTKPVQNARTAHGARLNTQDAGRPGRGADLKTFHHSAPMRVYVCASERPTHSCHTALTTLSSYASAQHKTDSQRPPHDQNTPPIRKKDNEKFRRKAVGVRKVSLAQLVRVDGRPLAIIAPHQRILLMPTHIPHSAHSPG